MSSIIEVKNLSKSYTISHEGQEKYTTLRDVMAKNAKKIFSFSNAAHKEKQVTKEEFWALKNIDFKIAQGDRVGIIGRNGAGKSTLLKILSRIVEPTTGSIKIKGRVASLLEVGTGFHPELTGRENIFLNGAILGMSRVEIKKHFDAIVDFAEIEKFLDTPVKRYSSGMYVRLAFAVAAHLEPEILVVDEVLAVGDTEFQKKCLGKMEDVSKTQGRTVIFVSHNMQAITTLTQKSIFLNKGELIGFGNTSEMIRMYLEHNIKNSGFYENNSDLTVPKIIRADIKTSEANYTHYNGEAFEVEIEIFLPAPLKSGAFAFQILNNINVPIVHCWILNSEKPVLNKKGINKITCRIPKFRLYMGSYRFRFILADNSGNEILQTLDDVCDFQVEMFAKQRDYQWVPDTCTYLEDSEWQVE